MNKPNTEQTYLTLKKETLIQTSQSQSKQTNLFTAAIYSDDLEFPRSWLLPVIRDNVQETELAFFTAYFLPLAAKLRQRGNNNNNEEIIKIIIKIIMIKNKFACESKINETGKA